MEINLMDLDYVVLRTGYTGRILNRLSEHNLVVDVGEETFRLAPRLEDEEMVDNLTDILAVGDDEFEPEDILTFLHSIVFIKDSYGGDGIFHPEETESILQTIGDRAYMNGTIAFKTTNFSLVTLYVKILSYMQYCGCLGSDMSGIVDMKYFRDERNKVMFISFDTESG